MVFMEGVAPQAAVAVQPVVMWLAMSLVSRQNMSGVVEEFMSALYATYADSTIDGRIL
jgi:hypothetical protein